MPEDKIIHVFAAVVVGLLVFIAACLYNIFTELKTIRSKIEKAQGQSKSQA
jgi:cell division protein FtsL